MAPAAPSRRSLVDDALVLLPTVMQRVVEGARDQLARMPRHHALYELWQRQGPRLADGLARQLEPLLRSAATARPEPAAGGGLSEGLSLVDEQQALRDVAIAHAINVIEEHNRTELHELTNFFAATQGTARARKTDNPLRAALFSQAYYETLQQQLPVDGPGLYEVVKVTAPALAQGLQLLYANLCEQLRQAELSQLVASHAAARSEDLQLLRRAASNSQLGAFAGTDPQALDKLSRRVELANSRPQFLNTEPAPLLGPATLAPGKDLLSRLYDQILADPQLLPPIKARLARLQVAVSRLALQDLSLLRRQDHPTWQLLNRVAAHGMGFERSDDPLLLDFLKFLDGPIEQLVSQPQPSAAMFQQALSVVKQFIAAQARQRSAPSEAALAVMEREQMRGRWEQVLREQVDAQLDEAAMHGELNRIVRAFLRSVWVEVIVNAMVKEGRESPATLGAIELVDTLLSSLQPPSDAGARERLRRLLPSLVQQIERGMDSVGLPQDKRRLLLDELMKLHGQLLLGQAQAAPPAPERRAAAPRELSPEEQTRRLLAERESAFPSSLFHTRIDRGALPTVPMPLYAEGQRAAIDAWMAQLQLGPWYHLFVQGEWVTAQITRASDKGQLFLFVGQDGEQRHSLTRGAIEQLLSNGLITALDEQTLVQRAIEQLMNDLDSTA